MSSSIAPLPSPTSFHSVKTFGAIGNGIADDTAAVTAAMLAAETSGFPVYVPPGNYLLVSVGGSPPKCVSITGSTTGFRMFGSKGRSIITFDSSTATGSDCFRVNAGCSAVSFEDLRFEGYAGAGYDDFATNVYAAIRVLAGSTDIVVDNNTFNKCGAIRLDSNTSAGLTTERLTFTRNMVLESPVSIAGGCVEMIVEGNWFLNAVPTIRQSHAIYCFGNVEKVMVRGNVFRGHGDSTVDFRGTTSPRQSKRDLIMTGNRFENSLSYISFIGSQGNENNIGRLIITGNTCRNVGGLMLIGARDSIISDNVMEWDYEYLTTLATGVNLIANIGNLSQSIPSGNIISNNVFINRHPYFGIVDVNALPSAGDQVVVGTVTYTWTACGSPSSGEITIGANVNACAQNLAYTLQGRSTSPFNLVLRELNDVWYSSTPQNTSQVAEGKCWIASHATFTLSRTGTALVLTAVADCSDHMIHGVLCANTLNTLVTNNTITGGNISLQDNIAPIVKHNVINPGHDAYSPAGINAQCNTWPIYEGNEVRNDRSLYVVEIPAANHLMSYDAFPVIRGGGRIVDQKIYGAILTLPWLQGDSGYVNVGNGKARMYIWYGRETGTLGDPAGAPWQWQDGDSIHLYNGATTIDYTFTFKRTAPNGTTEFNSYATLVTLINGQTAGSWVATNPVLVYGGSDLIAAGYIEIEAAATGVERNLDAVRMFPTATTNRGSRTCGQYLRPWGAGGIRTPFSGGAATAIKTVVYSPIASTNSPLIVCGVDAASQELAPISYQADTIPGVCYVITHAKACGTEKFFYKVG